MVGIYRCSFWINFLRGNSLGGAIITVISWYSPERAMLWLIKEYMYIQYIWTIYISLTTLEQIINPPSDVI